MFVHAVPTVRMSIEIAEATDADREPQGLRAAIHTGYWDMVQPYKPIKDELIVRLKNIILQGSRIVVPSRLQHRAIDIAHEGNQGICLYWRKFCLLTFIRACTTYIRIQPCMSSSKKVTIKRS